MAEYVPRRVGLGPIEWTAIFIGTTVATTLITSVAQDYYQRGRACSVDGASARPSRGSVAGASGSRSTGRGEVLRKWTTDEDQDEDEARPGARP